MIQLNAFKAKTLMPRRHFFFFFFFFFFLTTVPNYEV